MIWSPGQLRPPRRLPSWPLSPRWRWPMRRGFVPDLLGMASSQPGYDATTGLPVFTSVNGLPAMGCAPALPPTSCSPDVSLWPTAISIDVTTLVPCVLWGNAFAGLTPCPDPIVLPYIGGFEWFNNAGCCTQCATSSQPLWIQLQVSFVSSGAPCPSGCGFKALVSTEKSSSPGGFVTFSGYLCYGNDPRGIYVADGTAFCPSNPTLVVS
jgi:hypothetical protein